MRICILGATGLVGRESITLIRRAWPKAEIIGFASRRKRLEHDGETFDVLGAPELELEGAPTGDLALVALDDEHSKRYVPRLVELGYKVVDKSNTYRMDPDVPLVSAGVNCGVVSEDTSLVANPNCTTIPFTMAVAPLAHAFGLASVAISSYQAISGAGIAPLDSFLEDNRTAYAEPNRLGVQLDPTKYAGNTVPHSGKTDESGFSSEERKLMNESRKILDAAALRVSAQCCRVPVAVGHFMNVWLELKRAAPLSEIEAALARTEAAPYLKVSPGPVGEGLTALDCVHNRDQALAGRLRLDPRDASGKTVCLTIAGDNLRLGAATNAIRIASRWFESADAELQAPGNMPAK
ncbi:MAG: aspartate-semialdehyde dehydrogenase [Nannocystaceae bacterium]|nr:aspartate-semialdehyde dehydrogenase [bacterium]